MYLRLFKRFILSSTLLCFTSVIGAVAESKQDNSGDGSRYYAPTVKITMPITTQGPLWPPSSLMDKNGDFILVGNSVAEVAPGINFIVPGQAAIISKHTVPPLDSQGKEDFSNPFGSVYKVVRLLDLKKGSDDLKMELYSNSFGPAVGDFGGGARIPREGNSRYNLNGFSVNGTTCAERFPTNSQKTSYKRDSVPLNRVPIPGFQGDQLAFDVNTGDSYTPRLKNGSQCFPSGCEGEDKLHKRVHSDPITLGEWLKAKVSIKIKLTQFDKKKNHYTAARFTVSAKNLLPNAMYNVVVSRTSTLVPSPIQKITDVPVPTAVLITDEYGKARRRFTLENPFPARATDDAGNRIVGFGLIYKSDYTISGHCAIVYGPGVDVHAVANTVGNAKETEKLNQLITVSAIE